MHADSLPDRTPGTMFAMALDRHGGDERPRRRALPVPAPGPTQLLVRVHAAGVGHWDLRDREGSFARRRGQPTSFPHVQGSEGAGIVVAVGRDVVGFREGERVYGLVPHRDPHGGCHAEYALFEQDLAWPVPPRLSLDQAAVVAVDGGVALRGLRDVLRMRRGESLVLFGASGGMGHFALQFARQMGVRVLAIASGSDGVRLAERLGADDAIDGTRPGIAGAMARFAPDGADAALLTAGGHAARQVVDAMPVESRIARPHGVSLPRSPASSRRPAVGAYAAAYDAELLRAMHAMVDAGPFVAHVSRRFPLVRVAEAQAALAHHHLGRIAVMVA